MIHDQVPTVTAQAVSVTNDTGAPTDDFPRRQLTRVHGNQLVHAYMNCSNAEGDIELVTRWKGFLKFSFVGILMILAWPLLVVSAIFFALWMKPALPNGEWFQVC